MIQLARDLKSHLLASYGPMVAAEEAAKGAAAAAGKKSGKAGRGKKGGKVGATGTLSVRYDERRLDGGWRGWEEASGS